MAENKLDRRSWMSGVGAAAAGMALSASGVDAQTPATPPQATSPAALFQPARHAITDPFPSEQHRFGPFAPIEAHYKKK